MHRYLRYLAASAAGIYGALLLPQYLAAPGAATRLTLQTVLAALLLLRPKPLPPPPPPARPLTFLPHTATTLGLLLTLTGTTLSATAITWPGLLLLASGLLLPAISPSHRSDLARATLLLLLTQPLPTTLTSLLEPPLRFLTMHGAGALLLALDVDVWTEPGSIHSGFRALSLPNGFSPLIMAATLLPAALGLALLLRLKTRETTGLLCFTAILNGTLNVTGLALTFVFTPSLTRLTPTHLLEGLALAIPPLTLLLTTAAALLWRHRWRTPLSQPIAARVVAQQAPPPWQTLPRRYALILPLILLATLMLYVLYRNRPEGRRLALEQVTRNASAARNVSQTLHLTEILLQRTPDDPRWLLLRARTLLAMHRFADAQTLLNRLPDAPGLTPVRQALKVYTLLALQRPAAAALATLQHPPGTDPRIAMIMTELAFQARDLPTVVHYARLAARHPPNLQRLQRLLPFLRLHHAWHTILTLDQGAPYADPATAFIILEAHMNLARTQDAARMTRHALSLWPQDPRLLEPLFYLALRAPGDNWPELFASHLKRQLQRDTNPDTLYPAFEKCFTLGRPDLAWQLYERIRTIDPNHPALPMAVVEFGHLWFTFQKHVFGLPAASPTEQADLRALYLLAHRSNAWRDRCALVPLGELLSRGNPQTLRRRHLAIALAAFKTREADAPGLTLPMRYLYALALEMAERPTLSNQELGRIATDHPAESHRVRVQRSEMAERQGNWEAVYELLRTHNPEGGPQLPERLRLARAQRALNLLPAAAHTARSAWRRNPQSSDTRSELALTLLALKAPAQALHLLTPHGRHHTSALDQIEIQALMATQRYRIVEPFSRTALLPLPTIPDDSPQTLTLPPAEQILQWHTTAMPTAADLAAAADHHAARIAADTDQSPFLRALRPLWLECYRTRADDASSRPERWIACGRDAVEQATALHQLAILLCHEGRTVAAGLAMREAVARFPESAELWRWRIGLANRSATVIREAFQQAPEDPEIWLAYLHLLADPAEAAARDREVARATATAMPYPAEALARGAEWLLRNNLPDPAMILARRATAEARGLLPAYLLGLRAAMLAKDRTWALDATRGALAAALRPPPALQRKFVEIKADDAVIDTSFEMIDILRSLRDSDPTNRLWLETLGYVHFNRDRWDTLDALDLMTQAITTGTTNTTPYLIAAESARRLNEENRAITILRDGLTLHPGNTALQNNLAHILARTPAGLREALTLAPLLAAAGQQDPRYLETAADIFIRAQRTADAEPLVARLEQIATPGTYLWFRTRLHRGVLALRAGDIAGAVAILNQAIEKTPNLPEDDRLEGRRMLNRWRERIPTD